MKFLLKHKLTLSTQQPHLTSTKLKKYLGVFVAVHKSI